MSREQVMQKIKEMVAVDKSLIGATITVSFIDKKTKQKTTETITIEES